MEKWLILVKTAEQSPMHPGICAIRVATSPNALSVAHPKQITLTSAKIN
jgi:hypothetical protein